MKGPVMHVRTDLGVPGQQIDLTLVPVAVETDYNADHRLKAYEVDCGDEWCMYFHAESAGKAKSLFLMAFPGVDDPEWTDIRARRCIGADLLDIAPFTDYTMLLAGYHIRAYDEEHILNAFLADCPCSMCAYERAKPAMRIELNPAVEA